MLHSLEGMNKIRPVRSKARTWSALGLGLGIFVVWWAGPWTIRWFLALVAGGACWEIYLRLRWPANQGIWNSGAIVAGIMGLGVVGLTPWGTPWGIQLQLRPETNLSWLWIAGSLAFVPGWWYLQSQLMRQGPRLLWREFALGCAVMFYVAFPLIMFRDLVTEKIPALGGMKGNEVFMASFGLLWILDSGALLIGKRWGHRPLHSKISPSKTLEGSLGGWLLCIFAGWLLYPLIFGIKASEGWGWFSILVGPAGIAGDLMQSALKRKAGIKDSGSWIPGHGGWLDRFDSLLTFAALLGLWQGLGL